MSIRFAGDIPFILKFAKGLIKANRDFKYPIRDSWIQKLIGTYKQYPRESTVHITDLPANTSIEFKEEAKVTLRKYISGKTHKFPHYFLARYVWGMRKRILLETLARIIPTEDLLKLEKSIISITIWPGKIVKTRFPLRLEESISWARMMGFAFDMYIGDGAFSNTAQDLLKIFANTWHEISGFVPQINKLALGVPRIHTSKLVKHVFSSVGFVQPDLPQILAEPKFPSWVFGAPEEWEIELLRCMFDSEGDIINAPYHKSVRLTQAKLLTSERIVGTETAFGFLPSHVKELIVTHGPPLSLLSASLLLFKLGVTSRLFPALAKPNRYGTLCVWRSEIQGKENVMKFKEKIRFFYSKRKNQRLQEVFRWANEVRYKKNKRGSEEGLREILVRYSTASENKGQVFYSN